jgi:hypothetical protein
MTISRNDNGAVFLGPENLCAGSAITFRYLFFLSGSVSRGSGNYR